jgi:putative chitinase
MSRISLEALRTICPHAGARAVIFVDALNDAMAEFGIDTPLRQAAFIAQIAHESGEFRYTREIASGDAYEYRADLGNTAPGDGRRFKGRGLIQITGRNNYRDCSIGLYGYAGRLLSEPALLEQTVEACRSAGWYWRTHRLNTLADASDFDRITHRINGGMAGLASRLAYYVRAIDVLMV